MGLSSSKTKTQSTTTSSPLDQYAPYINRGLATAQNVLDANQGNLAHMSQSAYGLYDDLASSIGRDGGQISERQPLSRRDRPTIGRCRDQSGESPVRRVGHGGRAFDHLCRPAQP